VPTNNHRLYYAIQQVGMAKDGTQTFIAAHGVQNVGITTTFNLEQVFELGQLAIYQLVEQVPDVEVTMEKVLDGYPLLYHLATNGATSGTLVGRSAIKTIVGLAVFAETSQSATGAPLAECQMSGMFISSLTYTFPTDGNATEAVTLVGNTKVWNDVQGGGTAVFSGVFSSNADQPMAITGSGGVQQRWNILFDPSPSSGAFASQPAPALDANGATNQWLTVLPTNIYGITSSGTNPLQADGSRSAHISSITVTADLGRDQIFELGRRFPYFRYVTFPVEVRTEIEVTAVKFDNITVTEAGGTNGAPAGSNLTNQTIRVRMQEGTMIDLGTTNKLSNVAWTGGDATQGGGNVVNRFSFLTYNNLLVSHPADPSGL
jgi:hypothetical protein